MKFLAADKFGCRALLAILGAAALPVAAQQSVQFSRPSGPDVTAKANAFLAPNPANHFTPGAFNAPAPLFGDRSPTVSFDVLPTGPVPIVSTVNSERWRKYQDVQKNWALSTPEEILDIPTPEKILNVTNPKEDPKLSMEERYLQRRQQDQFMQATNSAYLPMMYQNGDARSDIFAPVDPRTGLPNTLRGSGPAAGTEADSLFDNLKATVQKAKQKLDSTWEGPFASPDPLPKQTADQLAAMDRFRALMEAPPPQKAGESHLTYQSSSLYQPLASPGADPAFQSSPSSSRQSYRSLPTDIAKPTGVAPVPGLNTPRPTASKRAPLVDPPPWINQSSQPFSTPQRPF